MTADLPRCIHLSASSISAFKACPTRFRFGYVEGLRLNEDTESQRMGTNWHTMHEVYRDAQRTGTPKDEVTKTPFDVAMEVLNNAYIAIPSGFDPTSWEVERTILATSFAGHCWLYQNDPVETLATEVPFRLPLHHPKTGLPLSGEDVLRVGKIDRIVRYSGRISIADYKSTSKSISADSDFWNHLSLDSQISMYAMATAEMAKSGMLVDLGIPVDADVAGAFYDVWEKPKIRPSKLTQGETKEFLNNGKYMDAEFIVSRDGDKILVNGRVAEYTPGAKEGTGAIRETPDMFGARLLLDIYTNPDKHFARREIARNAGHLRAFRSELYSIYQTMKQMRDTGHWFHNEHSCNATFRCAYTPICFHGVDVTNGQTPPGFKRIFQSLTVEGNEVEI